MENCVEKYTKHVKIVIFDCKKNSSFIIKIKTK